MGCLVAPLKKRQIHTRLNILLTEQVDPGFVTITLYRCHFNMNDDTLVNH